MTEVDEERAQQLSRVGAKACAKPALDASGCAAKGTKSGATGMHRSKQARTALRAGGKQLPLPANARPAGLSEHPSSEVLIRPARPRKNK